MQNGMPAETAMRIYRRYLQLEPMHTEEYIAYLRNKVSTPPSVELCRLILPCMKWLSFNWGPASAALPPGMACYIASGLPVHPLSPLRQAVPLKL